MHPHTHLLLALLLPTATAKCYPPGATFPIPDYALVPPPDIKLPTNAEAPWPTNTTSYAVQVTTAENTIFSAYHTADILGEYRDGEPSEVTGDTYFRIASNTKVFTVLAVMLTEGMSLDDGILKYIPELVDGEGGVEWEDITLGALGGHLAGVVREYAAFDLFGHGDEGDLLKDPVSHGFPPLPKSAGPPCGITGGDVQCIWKRIPHLSPPLLQPNMTSRIHLRLLRPPPNVPPADNSILLQRGLHAPLPLPRTPHRDSFRKDRSRKDTDTPKPHRHLPQTPRLLRRDTARTQRLALGRGHQERGRRALRQFHRPQ
ncbi:unnamed protein product [Tuber melanosporum]|uniref:(Perigord truffle) hypothetical protein n=1 Tax=Tuber melanosporum (strain Mel28) TaxID=656061 RepID=D5GCX4_TUBMM|nr:uncharacterized protein GSTUM_00000852001 [Tuber melanosporum]CAZ82367.1 unnamed protein product [Tuber melanosporum]